MKHWYGTELASTILSTVTKACINPKMIVIGGTENDPYYRGICQDAKKCGVTVISLNNKPDFYSYPAISLNSKIKIPDKFNLDGGNTLPCTAEATIRLLKHHHYAFAGADVVILGRSERVGKPLSKLLTDFDSTVTLAHSYSKEESINLLISNADLIISCVGKAGFTNKYSNIKKNTTLVDIGGDFIGIKKIQNYVPPIGGIGPITRAVLMEHVFEFWRKEIKNDD